MFEYLDNKMYIDVKEAIKKYILVRMKEARRDALSLEPILSLRNLEGKLVVTNGDLWALLDFCTHLFLMMF